MNLSYAEVHFPVEENNMILMMFLTMYAEQYKQKFFCRDVCVVITSLK